LRIRSKLWLLSLSLLAACANVKSIWHGPCETVIAQPGYIWQGSQGYTTCWDKQGNMHFPFGAPSNDVLTNTVGPVAGALANHVVVAP